MKRRTFLQASLAGWAAAGAAAADARAAPPKELYYQSATRLLEMIRRKEVSSEEVVKAHLERINAVHPKINAVVHRADAQALEQARKADQAVARGQVDWVVQPLFGLPVTIKDCFDVAGWPTVCGVPSRKDHVATGDATAVRKLKEAGAIILGKTNVPPLCWKFETENPVSGRTNNPYDVTRTSGGSSGGEAALIAAGGSPLGLGSDEAGSIRLPAHFCGLAGLRPAWGRVSLAGAYPPASRENGHYVTAGPLARHVEDVALALAVLSGQDAQDPYTFPVPLLDYRQVRLRELKIAWAIDTKWDDGHGKVVAPTGAVRAAVEQAAKALSAAGARVEKACPPEWTTNDVVIWAMWARIIAEGFPRNLEKHGVRLIDPGDRALIDFSRKYLEKTKPETIARTCDEDLPRYQTAMLSFLDRYDAFLCPVQAGPAIAHGTWGAHPVIDRFHYTTSISLVPKVPAGSVRFGWSPEGLPIGVQVVGQPYREDIVLRVMQHLQEQAAPWKPPTL